MKMHVNATLQTLLYIERWHSEKWNLQMVCNFVFFFFFCSKSRLTRYDFCVLQVVSGCFTFVKNFIKISQTVFNLKSYVYLTETAMFNVQRAITPLSRQTRVTVHVFCMLSHSAWHLCEVSWKYLGWYQLWSGHKWWKHWWMDGQTDRHSKFLRVSHNTLTTFCGGA